MPETRELPNLFRRYRDEVVGKLMQQQGWKSPMQVPRLVKVILNMGVGSVLTDKKQLDVAVKELSGIAGQKAIQTRARQSVANFKVREGWAIGCKVTLRRFRMYEFLERLMSVALPGIRDFRGLGRKSFDGRGNFSLGIREQIIFPEIDYDRIEGIRGLDVCIVTNARSDDDAYALFHALQFPMR